MNFRFDLTDLRLYLAVVEAEVQLPDGLPIVPVGLDGELSDVLAVCVDGWLRLIESSGALWVSDAGPAGTSDVDAVLSGARDRLVERMVREAGKRIYRQRGVRNIDLLVDDGVPACDDGGEPLLGCYTPSHPDDLHGDPRGPEIRIFYRTFQAAFQDEPTFDVRAEIDETIDHEVTHHLHFLAGDDPLDDDERDAIVEENVRRIGKREATRRAGKELVADVGGFFRTAWPLLLVAFIATFLGFFRCQ